MSIWNKVLLGLICVASLALFYLGARTLKTHQHWRNLAQQFQAEVGRVQAETYTKREGVTPDGKPAAPGVRQVRQELNQLLVDRGRVWHDCMVKVAKVDKAKGTVDVNVAADAANFNSLANKGKLLVYAFEEKDAKDGGRYLGEFRVVVGADKQPMLQSSMMMTPREIDRISSANGPWVLYEQMPRDNHDIFAALTDEQKKALLPPAVVTEYLKDGKPADKDDPAERATDGKYGVALRDYHLLFLADRLNQTENLDAVRSLTYDKGLIESALADAKRQEQADEKHLAEAQEKLRKFARERDIVKEHGDKLQAQRTAVSAEVAKLLEATKATADQLDRSQREAVRRIDQRVRHTVQTNAGG